jgi:ADP-ribose pyrophosphatase YjhB (NUDIX family)
MATHYIVGCGAVASRDDKYLMVRQMGGYWKELWIFPGGKLEIGETLEACARREFKEETGCEIAIKKLIGAYISYDPDTEYEKQVVLLYYKGSLSCGEPVVGEGVTDVGWFTLPEINKMASKGMTPALIMKVAEDSLSN